MPLDPALVRDLPRPADLDIRLVAVDMDGTLLDDEHRIDPTFWPLLAELRRRGITFCPASGRQHATLARQFSVAEHGSDVEGMVVISENGAYVVRGEVEVSSHPLSADVVAALVRTVRDLAAFGTDVGVVVCGKRSAYIERPDVAFRTEADRYYARLELLPSLLVDGDVDDDGAAGAVLAFDDDVLKVSVYDFDHVTTTTAPALAPFTATHQVVVSGRHWVDVLVTATHKGAALREVQASLGVSPAQTVAFGDYLNDLQLLDAAELSFAMANAHPAVLERARFVAPSNNDNGVVRVLAALLGVEMAALDGRDEPPSSARCSATWASSPRTRG